jgi:hypothetical protein
VEGCIKEDQRYIRLFKEMIDNETDGISATKAMDLCDLSVQKIAEGPAVKEFHVLSYDIQNRRFQFHSRTMYHATKKYMNEMK